MAAAPRQFNRTEEQEAGKIGKFQPSFLISPMFLFKKPACPRAA